MRFSPVETEEVSLNLAPLIDVVFLLLIFFMVTTSFTQENAIDLKLPEASSEQPREQSLVIDIIITNLNEIIIENDQSRFSGIDGTENRKQLGEKIEQAIAQLTDADSKSTTIEPTIVIQADKSASHGRVIQLMDAIARLGIHKIQFAVEPERPE